MFKLVLISVLVAIVYCAPADKPGQERNDRLDQSETTWNSAWANPAAPGTWQNPNAWGANNWNRWNNPAADPRWNRWGAEPWNRGSWGSGTTGWNQWNRAGNWPASANAANRNAW
ncbi:bifunctional endo-1,4-beta-xylanase XylA-like [Toxorhynchites rutilus septentrionalis]|uniref:bifunctional endo-1,4-beta-xylanase XylA-like n=1 Tax=Toxorhynchites rutilus septentrionalis TaxID=329112 RepID=UPI0024799742|nr:bifunctional endo-1,4-beta-xylanase XylA-like [Toxorhynchites rutilus septentrionalis]